jgi:hypothetical protein
MIKEGVRIKVNIDRTIYNKFRSLSVWEGKEIGDKLAEMIIQYISQHELKNR